jgi:hypothetical protein
MSKIKDGSSRRTFLCLLSITTVFFFVTSCKKEEQKMSRAEILSSTRWKSTVVKDSVGVDVTSSFQNFMGLATYNKNGTYEFFTLNSALRGDRGYGGVNSRRKQKNS